MAYRVTSAALVSERVPRQLRVRTGITPDGRIPRQAHVTVFLPRGAQQGGGGDGGTQLNRGLN